MGEAVCVKCGKRTPLECPFHATKLCALCECPDCEAGKPAKNVMQVSKKTGRAWLRQR